jgi:hypothetical protein
MLEQAGLKNLYYLPLHSTARLRSIIPSPSRPRKGPASAPPSASWGAITRIGSDSSRNSLDIP